MMRFFVFWVVALFLFLPLVTAQPDYFEKPGGLFREVNSYEGLMLKCPETVNVDSIKSIIDRRENVVRTVEDNEIAGLVQQCGNQPFFWVQGKTVEPIIQECVDKLSSEIGSEAKFLTEELREECIIEEHFRKKHFFLRLFRPKFYNSLILERQAVIKQKLVENFDSCADFPTEDGEEFLCEEYKKNLEKETLTEEMEYYRIKGDSK